MVRRLFVTTCVAVLTLAGCDRADGPADLGPTAKVTNPDTTTTTLGAIEREVEAAYLRSWEVFAKAALTWETSELADVFAGEQLERTRRDIEQRAKDRRRARYEVEHNYEIKLMDGETAQVVDRYRNHSVRVDADSLEPIEPDPDEVISEIYVLERREGAWKVTGSRADS